MLKLVSKKIRVDFKEQLRLLVDEEKKGCYVYITVCKEPKFVALVTSASVILFSHVVPQIHLVNSI